MRSVLIVEDDDAVRSTIATMLSEAGLEFEATDSPDTALALLRRRSFDVVLSDIRLPGRSGVELIGDVHALWPDLPIILMTGYASMDSAIEALRVGAIDYLPKPFGREPLLCSLERALGAAPGAKQIPLADPTPETWLIGGSAPIKKIHDVIRKVADRPSNILITGESGTGKELAARAIHSSSLRARRPFVPINCAAIPEGLLESELFGHVRGAFTGATSRKQGLVQVADGGTLFLDEIGDMAPSVQTKLLRVLQEREVRPVGSTDSSRVDLRVIAATNRDLAVEVEAGRFREDLFYRLNVVPIQIPPLRERPEDIPTLAEFFLRRMQGGAPRRIAPDAMDALVRMRFPGNGRELENLIERAVVLGDGEVIRLEDLAGEDLESSPMTGELSSFFETVIQRRLRLREVQEGMIREALKATHGNKVEAARILGISRRTVHRWKGTDREEVASPAAVSQTASAGSSLRRLPEPARPADP